MEQKKKKRYLIWNILFGVMAFLFVISFSIALPIMCRFIHTLCIEPMGIVGALNKYANREGLNYTFDDVVKAYNDVVDSCCFYIPFKSGGLKCPPEDVLHFEDCRVLFTIDFVVIAVSLASIVGLIVVEKIKKIVLIKPLTLLIAGITTILLPLIIGGLCAIDFTEAFVIFHHIFFPGKTNWLFDPKENFIILILPEEFFLVCAIVIGAGVLIGAATLIVLFFIKKKRIRKKAEALSAQ